MKPQVNASALYIPQEEGLQAYAVEEAFVFIDVMQNIVYR